MSVYVDDMRAPFRGMVMCHMTADTQPELLAMARRIGVAVKWLQKAGTSREHFDICLSKRRLAVASGAVDETERDTALRLLVREGAGRRAGRAALRELAVARAAWAAERSRP